MTDRCQANACGTTIEEGAFMCTAHWRMVPPALRRAVRRASQECGGWQGNPLYLPYLDACAQAVEIVALQEKLPSDNAFRRAATLLEEYMAQSS
ncbi:MAG TPA: hypothetical protein VK832_17685 [Burkholderiaceae bacterium]|nr:hypothetical protein [Burkholderiaceae bacterium]